jgi:hypothetical protein
MPRKPGQPRELYAPCKNPNHPNAKPGLVQVYWELYQQGLSLAEIAKHCNSTRTGVHNLLKSHGYKLRTQVQLESIEFNGAKYTLKPTGYYAKTNCSRSLLHRDMWEYHNGKIPSGYDVHHINHDTTDNSIENFQLMTASEHKTYHNQGRIYTSRAVKRLDTGEIYQSTQKAAERIGVTKTAIVSSMKRNGHCKGTKWEYVE